MHQIKPIHSLTVCEIKEHAQLAAERGEKLEEANFFQHDPQRSMFAMAFVVREHELRMTA